MEKSGPDFVRSYGLDPANQETTDVISIYPLNREDVEYSIEGADWQILNH